MAKEKICGIYCIENLINGKKYIGLSIDIKQRWKQHKINLKGNRHINNHLQSAWNKYKSKSFKFYIVSECEERYLIDKEIYYINLYKSNNRKYGYNKTSGGDGVRELSEECSEKISIAESLYPVVQLGLNGNYVNEYRNCAKAAESVNGRTENIRNCCDNKYGCKSIYGYMWIYKKDYDSNIKYTYIRETTSKPVSQYDLQNNFIATYKSAREAEKETGVGYKMISRVCNGGRPYTHGYIFKFTE